MIFVFLLLLLTVSGGMRSAHAQIDIPELTVRDSTTMISTRPVTAAEAAHHVLVRELRLNTEISVQQARYPRDSILALVSANAAQWLAKLQTNSVNGIQFDPASFVGIVAGNDAYARQQIARRLATPGLTPDERAFTLLAAIQAFASWHHPERLPVAEAYLATLVTLGDTAALWQFQAREVLARAYYMLGRSTDVVRHGTQAIALVRHIPFKAREFTVFHGDIYTITVEALTGFSDGHSRIEHINAILRAAAIPTPTVVALDSGFIALGRKYEAWLNLMLAQNALLGTHGQPLIAGYWINWRSQMPPRDLATIHLDDGTIRLVEFAQFGCPGCLKELYVLQRIRQQFTGVDAVFMTYTVGSWGNRNVPSEEESAHYEDHLVRTMKIDFPIGIWESKMSPNEDGGTSLVNPGPNEAHYPGFRALVLAIDGHGIIRRIFSGGGRDGEIQIARTIQFLQHEKATSPVATTAAMVP